AVLDGEAKRRRVGLPRQAVQRETKELQRSVGIAIATLEIGARERSSSNGVASELRRPAKHLVIGIEQDLFDGEGRPNVKSGIRVAHPNVDDEPALPSRIAAKLERDRSAERGTRLGYRSSHTSAHG